jgi:hypothetical protein
LDEKEMNDRMTTELLFFQDKECRNEVARRLKIVGLSEEQIGGFIAREEKIVSNSSICGPQKLATHIWITHSSTVESLPQPQSLSSSEIVTLVDDAIAARARDHEVLPDLAFAAVSAVLCSESQFQQELIRRFGELGLADEQMGIFIRNECMITERLKWSMHSKIAWQAN